MGARTVIGLGASALIIQPGVGSLEIPYRIAQLEGMLAVDRLRHKLICLQVLNMILNRNQQILLLAVTPLLVLELEQG